MTTSSSIKVKAVLRSLFDIFTLPVWQNKPSPLSADCYLFAAACGGWKPEDGQDFQK
jgi:hypothetical protein